MHSEELGDIENIFMLANATLSDVTILANTKHLYNIYTTPAQRLRRWSNIVQMVYRCPAFTGMLSQRCDSIHKFELNGKT